MQVRPKKKAPTRKGPEPTSKPQARAHTFPAPIRGWILNENVSIAQPGGALTLDNWICTTTGIEARGGTLAHVTLEAAATALFTYRSGATELFFGTTATKIYDISAATAGIPPISVSGQTGGQYSTQQFGTAGGDYLYAVNGADNAQLFDGATWTLIDGASTPAITGVSTDTLSNVWAFANRLFFVEKTTLNAWYLPVDSIGGLANAFSLAGIFKKGGSLLFGATWSLDAGDGLDDKCIFVSTEGEVAVYEGTNPGSAADWRKVGVYQITKPLGAKAVMQAGGDLLIATESGLVPISAAIQRDVAALELAAVSKNITPHWQSQGSVTGGADWEIVKWPQKNRMIVSQPNDPERTALVANLQTGGWSRMTGWDSQCLGFYDESAFYGDGLGTVYRMEAGGSDNGTPYTCTYIGQHESMGIPGMEKVVSQMRATFKVGTPLNALITAKTDYDETPATAPSAPVDSLDLAIWDVAEWDNAVWDAGGLLQTRAAWSAIGRTGRTVAPEVQITCGNTAIPVIELVSIDASFEIGALVT
ncbi:tubular tail B protein [Sulfitobacter phage phiGT1]|nr:tubular tail B protein [Sulfitobacter phage phiGT1]